MHVTVLKIYVSAGVSYNLVIHNIRFQSEIIGLCVEWLKIELVWRYAYIIGHVCMYVCMCVTMIRVTLYVQVCMDV